MMNKILLCDDDKDIASLMLAIIEPMGIEVSVANRIVDINQLVLSEKPNLILMDLWVPDIGGETAVIELKKHKETKDIPIYLFSANHRLEEICKEISADGCIKKPFDVARLRATLLNVLGKD